MRCTKRNSSAHLCAKPRPKLFVLTSVLACIAKRDIDFDTYKDRSSIDSTSCCSMCHLLLMAENDASDCPKIEIITLDALSTSIIMHEWTCCKRSRNLVRGKEMQGLFNLSHVKLINTTAKHRAINFLAIHWGKWWSGNMLLVLVVCCLTKQLQIHLTAIKTQLFGYQVKN